MSWGPRAQSNYRARKMAGRAAMRAYRKKAQSPTSRPITSAPVPPVVPVSTRPSASAAHQSYYTAPPVQVTGKTSSGAGSVVAMVIIGCPILMTIWFAFGPFAVFIVLLVVIPILAARLVSVAQQGSSQAYPRSTQEQADTEAEPLWITEAGAQRGELMPATVPRLPVKPAPSRVKPPPVAPVLTTQQKQDRDDLRMREEYRWRKEAKDRRVTVPALKTMPTAEANLERKLQGLERQVKDGPDK